MFTKVLGFFIFLFIFLMGFSMLLFLGLFVGYWLTLIGLEQVAPKLAYKMIGYKEEEA
ncbi:hypothetical protein [Croceimicrobium hydrocarbonivorans]|uniref:Uncharacterized protein n=1 Tax=Croceimicrobium hydrocarbonivorans TaxID=2761580 RepID=A0A7H0VBQ6_9FLAO|nr:hypothetical protein [Croceimicrobium hydrocarbonivorans]QNR23154.1 hypothetical protein H4K34_12305 [Croceimicrobium hydrocarbonivorans]|tara:strand:- start:666 stop:839 length:174 start_codon:yes stop_codon:yes gene_type:complete